MKTPAFDPATKHLIPCGELTQHDVSATYVEDMGVRVRSIWKDEAGLLWDLSDSDRLGIGDLKPKEWPKHCRANYIIGYGRCSSSPIHADSYDQAVALLTQELQREGRASANVISSIYLQRVCGV